MNQLMIACSMNVSRMDTMIFRMKEPNDYLAENMLAVRPGSFFRELFKTATRGWGNEGGDEGTSVGTSLLRVNLEYQMSHGLPNLHDSLIDSLPHMSFK